MKHKTHHLYYLFYPRGFVSLRRSGCIIISLLMLFSILTEAQETPPPEFVLDGYMSYESLSVDSIYNSYIECGFNTMTQRATDDSKSRLEDFNLHAINMQDSTQWIYYYSSSYYSKWEAEENQEDTNKVGVKHKAGKVSFWQDTVLCWSTKDITQPVNKLVFGPTYHQEKWYRRWLYMSQQRLFDLKYTPRFRMALAKHPSVPGTEDVCRIYVLVKYRRMQNGVYIDNDDSTYVLKDTLYLKVSDFPANGQFKDFYFSEIPSQRWYEYPKMFRDDITYDKVLPLPDSIYRQDRDGGQGVQFCIDWLRSDTLCTLYIDNIEVYDNNGWNQYVENSELVVDRITSYADSFKSKGWTNIKHWMGGHEPASIDCYTPIKTVDAILESAGAPSMMNTVWADWTLKLNGESQLERYYNTVQPEQLLVELAPVQAAHNVVRPFDLEVLRRILQESYRITQEGKFYFHIQTYGLKLSNIWHVWRQPTIPEYKAMLMLALSHGINGLVHAQYDSHPEGGGYPEIVGLIDNDYNPTPLWDELKDNSIPRLKGTLGKKLLTLNYAGDNLYLGRNLLEDQGNGFYNSPGPSVTEGYLTLTEYTGESTPPPIHYHAGFFSRSGHPLDNYFMLDNLITTDERKVWVTVEPPISGYKNYRFRNVEGVFDTTFDGYSNGIVKLLTYPAGEGYLYQVAPVVQYGGKLIYPETISSTTTLLDEMIIQNGATLTVNLTYNADRNIRIKAGGRIVTTNGGTIKFYEGSTLIVEGIATISGTTQNKLVLDFLSAEENGIIIKEGGSLTISNCKIKNANTGILSELNANYLNAQNVEFINCETHSISITGRSLGMNPTPPPQINYCTIQNSLYGILISNLSSIIIQNNTITNTDCGISLSNVTDAQITGNMIQSNTEELQGIFSSSSGGAIRANYISGHTYGIHLANSSPDVGGNDITDCLYHGMYIGSRSNPNMVGRLVLNLGTRKWYATSGYNKIYDNGGYSGGGVNNDGSEIYFYNSNASMSSGCNSIVDDRQPSPPLVNTLLLMNGYRFGFPPIQAQYNFWGDTVYAARFGNLSVNYVPYYYYQYQCTYPEEGEGDGLVMKTQFGEVIDTVYSTGAEVPELTETELAYAEAEGYFLTGNLTGALQVYDGIIAGIAAEEEKYLAYERKYSIGKLTAQSNEYFNDLSSTFLTLASNTQDTLNNKILGQFSTLSKVGEQEYETAIAEFDNIVQQNPNTEEAVYAEIDALTTALLLEEADSTLQKGRLGKYLIKSSADYNQRIDEILRKHFGSESKDNQKELIPTEFTLYQNYPNPFNPVTTIKYDLPNTTDVSLIIYDILGRRVKELVNAKQQPGRFEVQFNASNLASGVYIYQLIADKFISSKKMILLK